MRASTQYHLLHIIGATFGFLALFHTIFGLPNWLGLVACLFFAACVWATLRLLRHAKERGEPIFEPATSKQKPKALWLFPVVLFVLCFGWPFLPPNVYGGLALTLRERVIIGGAIYILLPTLVAVIRLHRERT